jgi:hypothetical protein
VTEKNCPFYGTDTQMFQHFMQFHFTLNMFKNEIKGNAHHEVSEEESEILYKYILHTSRRDKLYTVFMFDICNAYEVLNLYLEIQFENGLKELRDIITSLN